MPCVRISILRCDADQFAELSQMMLDAEAVLAPGIRALPGLIHFYTGQDEATLSLSNVSVWQSLNEAKQLDTYQPMLDLGKTFVTKGARFERPILNHVTQWEIIPE